MKLCVKLLIVFLLTLSILCGQVFSAKYQDTLRVGIYYGSGAVTALSFETGDGFCIGVTDQREFVPVVSANETSVTAEPDLTNGAPSYHVSYSAHKTQQEALSAVSELKKSGIDCFAGYINSTFKVLNGPYKNQNDALWAAENLAAKGTPISSSAKAVRLVDAATKKTLFLVDDSSKGLGIYNSNYKNIDSLIKISGSAKGTYRGGFECRILSDAKMTVVNIVPVEAYLYSVVCREMSPSWNIEALKAQAVCARNFSLSRINYHSKYGFDVCRTVCCQAYSTEADQSSSVHTAVDETRGQLLFYNDTLVQAVYSSSMGAYTEDVKNVWGSNIPYLVSVKNPYEDTENIYNGKWTKTLTAARATEIMKNAGYEVGEVTDIRILETTPAGGVLKLLVQGTNGSKTFERESCRSIFSEATYSQRYTVAKGGQTTNPTVYIVNSSGSSAKEANTVSVLSGSKSVTAVSGGFTVYDGKTKKTYQPTHAGGSPDTYTFSGEGWGHGVGMSQYGAKGMAEAGFDYKEILTHYYTGTHLENAY